MHAGLELATARTEHPVMEGVVVRVFGQRYVMPRWSQGRQTILAVKVLTHTQIPVLVFREAVQ